jgi:hypothetical protein
MNKFLAIHYVIYLFYRETSTHIILYIYFTGRHLHTLYYIFILQGDIYTHYIIYLFYRGTSTHIILYIYFTGRHLHTLYYIFILQGDIYTDGGIYAEDENKFIFNNVIIGRKAKARFKISNTNKVPCDVVFSVKPTNVKRAGQNQDIFEVEPPRAQISHHSHVYATVTFTPPSMQVC